EVRAALRPLHYVVYIQPAPQPAGLADPAGPREDQLADRGPLGDVRRAPAGRSWASGQDPPTGARADPRPTLHPRLRPGRPVPSCPRGQTESLDSSGGWPGGQLRPRAAWTSHSARHSRQPAKKIPPGAGYPRPGPRSRRIAPPPPSPRCPASRSARPAGIAPRADSARARGAARPAPPTPAPGAPGTTTA